MHHEILVFGGSGKLGRAIKDCDPTVITPSHYECDITDQNQVAKAIDRYQPEIVINCAALVGTKECETKKELAWQTNVVGAENIAKICQKSGIRYVFMSSAAIFDGQNGHYSETDKPTPAFFYAVTKVEAERIVSSSNNYVIVRLDFFDRKKLKYNLVLVDHYTSKIPVEEAARKIFRIAESDYVGVINIGQERKSLYEILKPIYPEIEPIRIVDSTLPNFPKDISLDLGLWNKMFGHL